MKFSVYGESLASRIRQFWDDLFTSRHVRFLEAELARVRVEKDMQIQRLQNELAMSHMPPIYSSLPQVEKIGANKWAGVPLSNYEAELQAHNKALAEEEAKEQKNVKQ